MQFEVGDIVVCPNAHENTGDELYFNDIMSKYFVGVPMRIIERRVDADVSQQNEYYDCVLVDDHLVDDERSKTHGWCFLGKWLEHYGAFDEDNVNTNAIMSFVEGLM